MAKSVALGLAMLFVVLAPTMVRSNSGDREFIFYANVIKGVNIVRVAGPDPPRRNMFGDIEVYDIPVTQSINSDAPPIALLQGIDVSASLDGTRIYSAFSIIFKEGKHKGSTLEVAGSLKVDGAAQFGELSVSGGTKTLRFSKGYIEVQTVREIPANKTVVLEFKIYLKEQHD